MKHIIDRILTRAQKASEDDKKLSLKVHEELVEQYFCNIPTIRDIELLVSLLRYDKSANYETHTKLQALFELLNEYFIIKKK